MAIDTLSLRYGRADSETARDYMVVGGTVHRDGRVEFEPSFKIRIAPKLVLTPEPDAAHDSHVRVDLLAANNEVLASQALYLPSHGKEFPFTATMPWSDRVASVVLVSDRRELGRLTRTERQLRVRLRPIPHSINGPTWLRWETTPKLVTSSVIVFSPDGGSTWQPIAIGVKGESLLLEPDRLPGTVRGKLRVLVSDGMNTESVESPGVISVPPKPPRVFISEPADGTSIPEGSHLILRGTAISPQLGLLKDR